MEGFCMTELVRSEPVIQAAKVTKYFGEDCVLKEADLILRKERSAVLWEIMDQEKQFL